MNITDFILNIGEYYKFPKDDNGKLTQVYQKEFNFYKGDKLDKVWEAIRRHHKKSFAPVIGEILECMEKSNVVENRNFKNKEKFYYHCEHCKSNFLIRSIGCPVCSWKLKENRPARTELTVVKCKELPKDFKFINYICPQCKKFKTSPIPKGAKCGAWGTFDSTLKSGKDCNNCPCFDCCNEIPSKRDLETGDIIQTLLDRVKTKYGDEDKIDVNSIIPPM